MRTFLTNVFSMMVGNLFIQAIGFVLSLVMLQRLSRAEYGLQSALVALASIVMAIAGLGMPQIAARELARRQADQQRHTYRSLLSFQLLLSGVACAGAALVALILGSFPGEQFIIFVFALFTLVLSYAPIVPTEALFAARGQARQIAILQSFYALCATVLGVLILSRGSSASLAGLFKGWGQDYSVTIPTLGSNLGLIYIALTILSLITITLYLWRARQMLPGGFALTYRPREWAVYLREGVPAGLGAVFDQSCLRLGTYVVYTFVSPDGAAYLGVSLMLIQAANSLVWIPYAINILPVMARLHARSPEHWTWVSSRSVTLLLAATLPIAVGTTLLAPDILRVLGESQVAAAPTLCLFIWALPLNILESFFYQMLVVLARQRDYMRAAGVGAAANLVLFLALIRPYGIEGVAVAADVGFGCIVLVCLWMLRGHLRIRLLDGARLAAALVCMGVAVQVTAGQSVFVRIGVAALVYGVVVLAMRLFTAQDRQTARTLLAASQEYAP
jgi:O-antigen/teichoic acid export membrane protein